MFSLKKEQNRLICLNDKQIVLEDIEVSASLYNGGERELSLHSLSTEQGEDCLGRYQRSVCHYEQEADAVQADLIVTCYERRLIVRVRAGIENKNAFGPQQYFSPEKAITIKIKNIPELEHLMANYRHKPWWCRPFFSSRIQELPPLTQSLLWQDGTKQYGQFLPLCDQEFRSDICGDSQGMAVQLSSFVGGLDQVDAVSFVLGVGEDPYGLIAEMTKTAAAFGNVAAVPREEKEYPALMDYLGWCTWDAFYHEVNEQGILEKANEFEKYGLPVQWVMIDDGWSQVQEGKLSSFDANAEKFPGGLKATVDALKSRYGIRWLGVWHTIAGYWGGIDPDSEIGRRYADALTQTNSGKLVPAVEEARGFGFWNAWHAYLKRQGIDFVKVDSQSAVNHFHALHRSVGEAARGAHDGLEASAALHFDSSMINCMGMASENIWQRAKSAVSRNSDDFVPQDKGSFREHALQNAYNSFYHGELYWGDWDMYWTVNHDDRVNMVLRAVSGGPIYISDAVGKTNPDLILPLVYQDGRILRCDQPGRPTPDCLLTDPSKSERPLKIWNTSHGSGLVAAFNVNAEENGVEGSISRKDVPGMSGDALVLYDVLGRRAAFLQEDEVEAVTLQPNECALYQLTPLQEGITVIGLVDKLVPMHAVECMEQRDSSLNVTLKQGGEFAFISEHQPRVFVNGEPCECVQDGHNSLLYRLDCSGMIEPSVEIAMQRR